MFSRDRESSFYGDSTMQQLVEPFAFAKITFLLMFQTLEM